jgi:integrase
MRAINLQTPAARARLKPQGKPYKVRLLPAVWLGYRAAQSKIGAWIVIASNKKGGYWTKAFAHADDLKQRADGDAALNYEQAAARARALARGDANAAADRPATILEALDAYEADLKGRGRRAYNAEWPRKHLPPHLTNQDLPTVTSKQLREWRDSLIKRGDLTPTSINKIGKSAMAAFTLAARLDSRIVANAMAWKVGLEMLPNSVKSRDAVITDAQVTAIVASAYDLDEAFGLFVRAHAETGARSSQLARCVVADLNGSKLMVPASHKWRNGGRGGHVGVPLTTGLAAALKRAAAGRTPGEILFRQQDGSAWSAGDHTRPFAKAAQAAGVDDATIYALRHSWIAGMLIAGLPIRLVAELHDTSAAIIEKHYGRFIAKHSDDLVRRALIDTTPARTPGNVVTLR